MGNSAALNYAPACAYLLTGTGGLPSACTLPRARSEVPLLLGCPWQQGCQQGTEGTHCDASAGGDLTPEPAPCSPCGGWGLLRFLLVPPPSALLPCWPPRTLFDFFPALWFWVISHGNDLSGSSALMPFPEPRLPDLPLMLITESPLGGFFLHHTLLKQTLVLFQMFELYLLLN